MPDDPVTNVASTQALDDTTKVALGFTPDDKKAKRVLGYKPVKDADGQTKLVWKPSCNE